MGSHATLRPSEAAIVAAIQASPSATLSTARALPAAYDAAATAAASEAVAGVMARSQLSSTELCLLCMRARKTHVFVPVRAREFQPVPSKRARVRGCTFDSLLGSAGTAASARSVPRRS